MLTIVPTPIGNLKDITLRSLETLQNVDGIICEDTRRTGLLLNHYQIHKPLFILNDFNESKNFVQVLEKLKAGENLALVSDAGMPLISDPGYKLVREALKENIEVDCLPGPSSIEPALVLSGLPPDKFLFLGFLPDKEGHRKNVYQKIAQLKELFSLTLVIFLSPYKIKKTLQEMLDSLGDIDLCLAKELSKIHQQVTTKKISDWQTEFTKKEPKGEWIMLLNV